MKRTVYQLATLLLLVAVTSCEQAVLDSPSPVAQRQTADFTSETNIPVVEPMREIAVGYTSSVNSEGGGIVTGLGQTMVPGGYKIWRRIPPANLVQGTWVAIDGPNGGGAVKIAGTTGDGLYAVTNTNELWRYAGGNWSKLPFNAVDVATSVTSSAVYFLSTESLHGGYRVYRLISNTSAEEVVYGGAATSIGVDQFGRPWITTSINEVYLGPLPQTPRADRSWALQSGLGKDITCTGTYAALIGLDNQIYYRPTNGTSSDWEFQGGLNVSQVTASVSDNAVWYVTASGQVYLASK
ncbi:hypothetical protein [Hymenobacter pini]|uniref:hypothetical protein n=1 Tax=Hymenobacter pini TaxID=2880879 RepID=UPI001CF38029|nr:hypothetical protein [Hymenobacter pini]